MIGHDEPLQLILNQTNPAHVGRMLAYYGYFARARAKQIDILRSLEARLAALGHAIETKSARLQSLESETESRLADLQTARQRRRTALAAIRQELNSGNQSLSRLQGEAASLESLLQDLERLAKDFPADAQQPFANMRGHLTWPVRGRITETFGAPRVGGLHCNGISIEAGRGAKVRATYFGRVIYADWLQGQGLLVIVEHNGGFLSLYGHNEVLYKSAGDWVAPGDVIASLAEGEGANTLLYFEIRAGRKPLDPRPWFAPGG
jgi:septal ring factor EnvC (AmiA/AmiB activator)